MLSAFLVWLHKMVTRAKDGEARWQQITADLDRPPRRPPPELTAPAASASTDTGLAVAFGAFEGVARRR